MNAKRAILAIGSLVLVVLAICPVFAVTVDSSYGWVESHPAESTVNGVFGSGDMGMTLSTNSWVIYDFGAPTTVSKVRVTAPVYGGSDPETYNPTSGTLEFSNDKTTWTGPIDYCAPQLDSIYRTDYAECALPQTMNYRYARWTLGPGRVGEIWFVASPQLAVWEMNQSESATNYYPAWQTVDGDPSTFGNVTGDPGGYGPPYITYDQGLSTLVHGFTMTARNWDDANPTSGSLWVSDNPTSGYAKVGDWTLPMFGNYETRTVDLGVENAQLGRYVQLRATGQWTEFSVLSNPVPEPGSILALSSGLIGLMGFVLRRRSK